MAGIKIDPSEVLSIANNISNLNDKLKETLESTKQKVKSLGENWTGDAAKATLDSFDQFGQKYYNSYYELLNQYVVFLKTRVAELYPEVDRAVAKLGEEIL